MADKNIEIGIKTTASGDGAKTTSTDLEKLNASGQRASDALEDLKRALDRKDYDQAAESTKEASAAITEFAEASGVGAGQVEELKAKLAAATEEMQKATKATDDHAEAVEEEVEAVEKSTDATKEAAASDHNASAKKQKAGMSAREMASKVGVAGLAVAGLGATMMKLGDEIGKTDKEMGDNIRTTGEWTTKIGASVSAIATGFAFGGPIGAAVAALGVGIKMVFDQMAGDIEEQMLKAQKTSEEVAARINKAFAARAQERLDDLKKQADAYDALYEAIDRVVVNLKKKQDIEQKIDDAQLNNELAQIEQAAANGELTPEEAIAKKAGARQAATGRRDQRAEALEKATIEQEAEKLLRKKDELEQLNEKLERAKKELDDAKFNPIATQDQAGRDARTAGAQAVFDKNAGEVADKKDKIKSTRDALDDAVADFETNSQVREINKGTTQIETGTAFSAAKKAREAKEAAATAKAAGEADSGTLNAAKDQNAQAGGDISRRASAAAEVGRASGNDSAAAILDTISKAFADGAISAVERGGVDQAVAKLNASATAKDSAVLQMLQQMISNFQQQEKQIANLKSRLDKGGN